MVRRRKRSDIVVAVDGERFHISCSLSHGFTVTLTFITLFASTGKAILLVITRRWGKERRFSTEGALPPNNEANRLRGVWPELSPTVSPPGANVRKLREIACQPTGCRFESCLRSQIFPTSDTWYSGYQLAVENRAKWPKLQGNAALSSFQGAPVRGG